MANTFKLKTESGEKSLNLKVNQKKCNIPSILLINSECIQNCVYTSEYSQGDNTDIVVDTNYQIGENTLTAKALELFLKTQEGKDVFNLFLGNKESVKVGGKTLFTSPCEGDFYNMHALNFIESTKSYVSMANALERVVPRCVSGGMEFLDFHSKAALDVDYYSNLDTLKKLGHKFYVRLEIRIYDSMQKKVAREKGWSTERLLGQLVHTIGHEFFLHGYRKAIPAMKAMIHQDYETFLKIIKRDTGKSGDYDHLMYLRKYEDEGLNLMYSFQDSLKKILGLKLFNEIKQEHDSRYHSIKHNKIPNESTHHTEY